MRTKKVAPWREMSQMSAEVIESARDTRKSLIRCIDMLTTRRREVLRIDEAGLEMYDLEKLTIEDRKQQLYKAMTWLNAAEGDMRRTRGALERAIERAERRIV